MSFFIVGQAVIDMNICVGYKFLQKLDSNSKFVFQDLDGRNIRVSAAEARPPRREY